jgi:hypothetical protein
MEYSDGLFNDGNGTTMPKLDDSFDDANMRFVQRIQELGVREAFKSMKGERPLALMMSHLSCGDISETCQ